MLKIIFLILKMKRMFWICFRINYLQPRYYAMPGVDFIKFDPGLNYPGSEVRM